MSSPCWSTPDRLGQKTGKGWYSYGDDRKPKPDATVVDLIRAQAGEAGIPQRADLE